MRTPHIVWVRWLILAAVLAGAPSVASAARWNPTNWPSWSYQFNGKARATEVIAAVNERFAAVKGSHPAWWLYLDAPGWFAEWTTLVQAKARLKDVIPDYVDQANCGTITSTGSVTMLTVTGALSQAGCPTNWLDVTPWFSLNAATTSNGYVKVTNVIGLLNWTTVDAYNTRNDNGPIQVSLIGAYGAKATVDTPTGAQHTAETTTWVSHWVYPNDWVWYYEDVENSRRVQQWQRTMSVDFGQYYQADLASAKARFYYPIASNATHLTGMPKADAMFRCDSLYFYQVFTNSPDYLQGENTAVASTNGRELYIDIGSTNRALPWESYEELAGYDIGWYLIEYGRSYEDVDGYAVRFVVKWDQPGGWRVGNNAE